MRLVNETSQEVFYTIQGGGAADCGTIPVDGDVNIPGYDNTENVEVSFSPTGGAKSFEIDCGDTQTGEQASIQLVVE